jgi:hypothetical protein
MQPGARASDASAAGDNDQNRRASRGLIDARVSDAICAPPDALGARGSADV